MGEGTLGTREIRMQPLLASILGFCERVAWTLAFTCECCRRAQRFASRDRGNARFASADGVRRFVQQAHRAVAIRHAAFVKRCGSGIDGRGNVFGHGIELPERPLRHQREAVAFSEPAAARIAFRLLQGRDHQFARVQALGIAGGAIVHLSHPDQHRDALRLWQAHPK